MNRQLKASYATGDLRVWIDGKLVPLAPSLKLFNHSPTGFNAGYEGSGPAQLALAVLLQCGFSNEEAVRLHQAFKREFLANQNLQSHKCDSFDFEFDVEEWAESQGQ